MTEGPSELDKRSAVTVGRIVSAHGLKGDLKVEPLTDFPDRFRPGSQLWLKGEFHTVERSRWDSRMVVIKLSSVDSRTAAEALQGAELMAPEARPIDDEGRYYLHDILGLKVEDEAGELLGELADVLTTGATDVYVVRGERGELLLPAIDDVIKAVELDRGRIVVELFSGLEFQKPSTPRGRRPVRRTREPVTPVPAVESSET